MDANKKVLCKFRCESVNKTQFQESVKLVPVTSDSAENKAFWQYTPSGEIRLDITNPDVFGDFVPGEQYFIEISKAVKA